MNDDKPQDGKCTDWWWVGNCARERGAARELASAIPPEHCDEWLAGWDAEDACVAELN